MENIKTEVKDSVKVVSKANTVLRHFFLNPFISGISGFTLFFLMAIFFDLVVSFIFPKTILTIDIYTVFIGFIGFILAFGLSFLESSQNSNE